MIEFSDEWYARNTRICYVLASVGTKARQKLLDVLHEVGPDLFLNKYEAKDG